MKKSLYIISVTMLSLTINIYALTGYVCTSNPDACSYVGELSIGNGCQHIDNLPAGTKLCLHTYDGSTCTPSGQTALIVHDGFCIDNGGNIYCYTTDPGQTSSFSTCN